MTLPHVALAEILKYCEDSEPRSLLNLAGVNRAFLDDRLWERYNIYGVSDLPRNYVATLKAGPQPLTLNMDFEAWLDTTRESWDASIEPDIGRLWELGPDHYLKLLLLKVFGAYLCQWELENTHPSVWNKWAAHFSPPQNKSWDLVGVGPAKAPYFDHSERDGYLTLAKTGGTEKMQDYFLHDREIALALAKSEEHEDDMTLDWSLRQPSDVEFMREVLDEDPNLYKLTTGEARLDKRLAPLSLNKGVEVYETSAQMEPGIQEDRDVFLAALEGMAREEKWEKYGEIVFNWNEADFMHDLTGKVFGDGEHSMVKVDSVAPRPVCETSQRLLGRPAFLNRAILSNPTCDAYLSDMANGYFGYYEENVILAIGGVLGLEPKPKAR